MVRITMVNPVAFAGETSCPVSRPIGGFPLAPEASMHDCCTSWCRNAGLSVTVQQTFSLPSRQPLAIHTPAVQPAGTWLSTPGIGAFGATRYCGVRALAVTGGSSVHDCH